MATAGAAPPMMSDPILQNLDLLQSFLASVFMRHL